jgi:hypothetical protein
MVVSVPQWLLTTLILSIAWLAAYAIGRWLRASASTRAQKSKRSPEPTPTSVESRVAQMEVDLAALFSTLEKLTTTIRRLSSRAGMQDLRAAPSEPPLGTSKAELRRHYGVDKLSGPAQARLQIEKERSN